MFCNELNGSGYLKMSLYIISQNELELRMDRHLCPPIMTPFKKFEAKVRVSILSQCSPYCLLALLLTVDVCSSCFFIFSLRTLRFGILVRTGIPQTKQLR